MNLTPEISARIVNKLNELDEAKKRIGLLRAHDSDFLKLISEESAREELEFCIVILREVQETP